MHRPKYPVYQIVIIGGFLEIEQGCFQFGQQFSGFFAIGGNVLFNHGEDPYVVIRD